MVSGPLSRKQFRLTGFVKPEGGLADGPLMNRPKVGEILVRAGLIDEMQLRAALGDQSNWGQRLGVTLVKMGLIEELDLVRALAQQLRLPVVELEGKRVQPEVLELVPADFAEKNFCVPLFIKENGGVRILHLGMEDPCNVEVLDDIAFRTGLKVQPVMVSPSDLCEAIDRFYRRTPADELGVGGGDAGSHSLGSDGATSYQAGVDVTPIVHESLFRDLSERDDEAHGHAPDAAAISDAGPDEAESEGGADPDTHRTVLRALCHLLIEKGVIGPDELQERIRSLVQDDESR
jgi:hypothetical protein